LPRARGRDRDLAPETEPGAVGTNALGDVQDWPHPNSGSPAATRSRGSGRHPAAQGILGSGINPRNQLLVLEGRSETERLLSRAGAERATNEQREQLQDIARGMDRASKANDDIAFMRLDRELNRLLIEAGHNDFAARSMKLLQGLSRRFWYMHYREAADLPLCARLHANQARALAQGDGDAPAPASDTLTSYVA